MLEPLFRCNLACAGCGKIQYPAQILREHLTVEQCLRAVEECGAPMVSIPGGEPLMYPDIGRLVRELVARRKYVYLCTNAILLKEKLAEGLFTPSRYLSFSVHMDGLREEHDDSVCREGVYDVAVEAIREALAARLPRHHEHHPLRRRLAAPDADVLRRDDGPRRGGDDGLAGVQLLQGPRPGALPAAAEDPRALPRDAGAAQAALEVQPVAPVPAVPHGQADFECTPWGNPTYNVFGWQRPCYLLQEGYAATFEELMATTRWERYGRASGNEKCQDCMVHCGYEPTAVNHTFSSWRGFRETVAATVGKL